MTDARLLSEVVRRRRRARMTVAMIRARQGLARVGPAVTAASAAALTAGAAVRAMVDVNEDAIYEEAIEDMWRNA